MVVGDRTLKVVDVQIDDEGTIHHILGDGVDESAVQREPVRGSIDPARRRDHMAQHTAQHILSRALVDVARAETVSSRLGSATCTIDVQGALSERDAARAEDLANGVVTDDVTVSPVFPRCPGGVEAMPLRRQPTVRTNVRIIDICGFDHSTCGERTARQREG